MGSHSRGSSRVSRSRGRQGAEGEAARVPAGSRAGAHPPIASGAGAGEGCGRAQACPRVGPEPIVQEQQGQGAGAEGAGATGAVAARAGAGAGEAGSRTGSRIRLAAVSHRSSSRGSCSKGMSRESRITRQLQQGQEPGQDHTAGAAWVGAGAAGLAAAGTGAGWSWPKQGRLQTRQGV